MTGWRLPAIAALLGLVLGAMCAWFWQANTYGRELAEQSAEFGKQLADKDKQYGDERQAAAGKALDQLEAHKTQRQALEARLQLQEQIHYTEMSNAQKDQARLRDRLATADLRLSVLIANPGATRGDRGLRETAYTGGVVDGATRVELDPAHAQRIVAITGDGDEGVHALTACQAYVHELNQ